MSYGLTSGVASMFFHRASRGSQDRRFSHRLSHYILKMSCAILVCFGFLATVGSAQSPKAIRSVLDAYEVPTFRAYGLVFFQVDDESEETASTAENDKKLDCMHAGATFRRFENIIWLVTVALAFLFYYLWLTLRPRWLSSSAKWTISPLISAVLVAKIVASYENFQLTQHCSQPSEWRFATFATTLVIHCLIAFGFFIALAILRNIRRTKRMAILRTE